MDVDEVCVVLTSTYGAADAAVGLRSPAAAAVTLIIHRHLQSVLEAHRFDGEALVGAAGGAAAGLHAHVERNLRQKNKERVSCEAVKETEKQLPV